MSSAVVTVREMLADAINLDSGLALFLSGRKVYSGEAPEGAALNYIVLGQTTETPLGAGYYGRGGHAGTEQIMCWARSKPTAQEIFAAVVTLLDGQRPVLSGHQVVKGTVEYVTDGPVQVNGKTVKWYVWGRYRIRSLEAA